jgi:hypothetical protein
MDYFSFSTSASPADVQKAKFVLSREDIALIRNTPGASAALRTTFEKLKQPDPHLLRLTHTPMSLKEICIKNVMTNLEYHRKKWILIENILCK